MITVEFRDFDDMVAFAKQLVTDITGKHETSEDQKKESSHGGVQKEEEQPDPVQEEQNTAAEEPQDEEPIYSLEQVRAKLAELQKAGKRAEVKELLNGFGVAKLPEILPEQYNDLMIKAGEI